MIQHFRIGMVSTRHKENFQMDDSDEQSNGSDGRTQRSSRPGLRDKNGTLSQRMRPRSSSIVLPSAPCRQRRAERSTGNDAGGRASHQRYRDRNDVDDQRV